MKKFCLKLEVIWYYSYCFLLLYLQNCWHRVTSLTSIRHVIATLKRKPRNLRLNRISHFTLESHSLLRKLDIASTVTAINWISRRQMRMELSLLFSADKYNVSNERSLSNCTAQSDTQIRHTHTHTHTKTHIQMCEMIGCINVALCLTLRVLMSYIYIWSTYSWCF